MEPIGEAVQGVPEQRRRLIGLHAAQQHTGAVDPPVALLRAHGGGRAAEEDSAPDPARRLDCAEPGLVRVELGGLGAVAVDVLLDHRIPTRAEVIGQLVAGLAVVERQAARRDHQVLVVVFPQPVDDVRHQLEYAAGALEGFQRGPVLVETIEDLGMDGVGLSQAIRVAGLVRLRRESSAFVAVEFREGSADLVAGAEVADRLEEPAPHDLERFLGGHGLPQRLHATEGLLQRLQRRHAACVARLDLGLRQRCEDDSARHQLGRLGERLHEGEVAVVRAAAQRPAIAELADVGHELVDEDHAGGEATEQLAQRLLAG